MVFQGNDTEGSGFSKKPKKRKHNNPLSQARGKQNKHENVWFRRSKAGYSLFVQYYMGQPIGTISSAEGKLSLADKEDMGSQKNSSDTNSGSNLIKTGKGMSRAAKRRNKKKDKRQNGPAISKDTSSTVPRSEVTVSTTLSNEDPPSLLESAYSRLLATDKAASHHNNFEFKAFLQAMSRRLPLSFRIRQYENDSERDETDFDKAIARLGEQEFLDLVEAIPFGNTTLYRAHSTKSLSSTTEVLCKARLNIVSPALKEFLVKTSQSGVLARQEIGSMLPVMALYDVGGLRAGSTVLDVCASPGSKTLQALEIIGPKGRVVANDVSESRLGTLKQALERSGMPSTLLKRIHFTCQDGARLEPQKLKSTATKEIRSLEFDAVLCDVPCSGDGTCRKDKHILPMWKPNTGNELHSLQLRILMRALKLVKVGGIVCYSTCTLNPIEDEAVVAAALAAIHKTKKKETADKKQHQPIVELIEWPALPGDLVRRPGISQWNVAEFHGDQSKNMDSDEEDDDAEEAPKLRWYNSEKADPSCNLARTMWPPASSASKDFHLEHCMRLWPQDRDTGGFFLALIRKNCEFS